ncbi:MAG: O-antigen ligase family protein [Thiolinea sp.]
MQKVVFILFVFHVVFLAYFNNFYVAGLPFRSVLILLCGVLVAFHQKEVFTEIQLVNKLYLILMVYGLLASLLNLAEPGKIINGELKLLQSYLVVLCGYYLVRNFGYKPLAYMFLLVVVPSAIVGILQGLEVNKAWVLHDWVSALQNKEISDDIQSQIDEALLRPPGLALYAIPQTYMLLSAVVFSSYLVLSSEAGARAQTLLLLVNAIILMGIVASETRSAMGAALFILGAVYFYKFRTASILLLTTLLIAGVAFYLLQNDAGLDSRIASLDDASAQGRKTLYKYGLELFLRQWWGYGFNFDTVEYAPHYFINAMNIFSYGPDEKAQFIVPVHNSLLNIMHTFGILGVIVFVYYLYRLVDGFWYRLVFIAGMLMNSSFHNAGILAGDLFVDMVIAALLYESMLKARRQERAAELSGYMTQLPPRLLPGH